MLSGIATAMARLVLEMRSNGRNTSANKRRIERLAVRFLRIAKLEREAESVGEPDKTTKHGYTM
jgi:hypothetical protein